MKKFGAVATLAASIAVIAGMLLPSANAQVTVTPVCPPGNTNPAYCTYYYVTPTPTATPTTTPTRKKTPSLSIKVRPKRDRSAPIRFSASGTLGRKGVAKSRGCRGTVTVRFVRGKKIVKRKSVPVKRSNCKYSAKRVKIKSSKLKRRGKLKVSAKFNGNSRLRKKTSKKVTVRYAK